ncbi:MAG TPA: Gfo/Idh/MocA family oxidoreductase [Woeseiaceae bacterium]
MDTTDRRSFIVQTAGALAGLALVPDLAEALPVLQDTRLPVGVIGVGRQGRAILAELQKIEQVDIAALCDVSAPRLEAAAGRLKDVTTFPDHRALLDARADVTAVIVATPTHLHRRIVEDCLTAGRHVFCEAPVAASVEDCEAIARKGAAAKTVSQAGFQGRSNPTYRRAQPLVDSELRQLISLYAQYHRKTSWRFPGSDPDGEAAANWRLDPQVSIGLAGEVGAQQFDVAHWFRGDRYPTRAQGRGAILLHKDGRTIPDSIEVELFWPDGPTLRYQASLASSYGGQHEVFCGSQGSIRLAWSHGWLFKEPDAPTQGWEVYATRQEAFGQEGIVLVADATKLAAQGELKAGVGLPHPSLYYALVDFVRSVTEGAPVRCSLQEGARATIVGILANQAVLTGQSVAIPPFNA